MCCCRTAIWSAWARPQRRHWRVGGLELGLAAGYVDAFRHLQPDLVGSTFPSWDPHVRLDFIFLPSQTADRLKKCEVLTNGTVVKEASDHFPLMSEISMEATPSSRET